MRSERTNVVELFPWDGVSSIHDRSFYKPHGIGRGPGLAICRETMYEPQIPKALRERMAAYDKAHPVRIRRIVFWSIRMKAARIWLSMQLRRLSDWVAA
jgi:hypothetical protein